MANRAKDWFKQAERDLEQAHSSKAEKKHEWACFAAQQSAEKAVKALHLVFSLHRARMAAHANRTRAIYAHSGR